MAVIAFIGLGQMGAPMAGSLVRAGHEVRGVDTAAAARDAAGGSGVPVVLDALEAVRGADAVITMFAHGATVLETYRALTRRAEPDTLFIDCSTIGVADAQLAHRLAREAGLESLDAPVTGGVSGAEAGSLLFLAGGSEDAFARAELLFESMGRRALHCGAEGTGQAAKLCNNLLLGISMIGVGEAFVLGERLGVAPGVLHEAMAQSSGQCWSLTSYCPVPGPVPESPANHDFAPGFTARQMHNDLGLATRAADDAGMAAVLGREAASVYGSMLAAGRGELDFSAVIHACDAAGPHAEHFSTVRVERRGRVGIITIHRPEALNALNLLAMQEIVAAAAAMDADDGIGCMVLTGSARAFAAGADVKEMQAMSFSDVYRSDWCAGWEALGRVRKPIVGAVAGFALGGGCEVAMMCDVLLAASSATFGQPEIKLGTLPGMGGSQRLTRLIGKPKAMEMCLTGRTMDAEEAERSGLVSRVVAPEQLLDEALRVAEAIAAMSLPAAMMVKEAVNAAYETTLGQGLRYERRLFHGSFATGDQKEGMAAFSQKRAPGFSHR